MRVMLRAIIRRRSAGLGAGREAGRPYMVATIMIRTYLVLYSSDLEHSAIRTTTAAAVLYATPHYTRNIIPTTYLYVWAT